MTESAPDHSPELPPPPRAITPRAQRRSWAELPVRFWLMVTIALAGATIFVAVRQIADALPRRWLIQNGVVVHAKFINVEGDTSSVGKREPRNEPMTVRLQFTMPAGDIVFWSGLLDAKPDAYAQVGQELIIRVDPNDPQRWTESDKPLPWTHELVTSLMLVPVVLILAIMTLRRRGQMLRVWTDGEPAPATVVELRQTAIAPRSRIVRFTIDGDPRIYNALMPVRLGIPAKGNAIWIIRPPAYPARAIIAAAYLDDPVVIRA